jgi:antitoxin (DNA-binding transcriptional repressor) of toxin-antitoxin stability system
MTVNVHEPKTNPSALLKRVEEGEEVTIARKPVAQLVPAKPKGSFPLGFKRGRIRMSDDFDDPLTPELLALVYGEPKKRKVRR